MAGAQEYRETQEREKRQTWTRNRFAHDNHLNELLAMGAHRGCANRAAWSVTLLEERTLPAENGQDGRFVATRPYQGEVSPRIARNPEESDAADDGRGRPALGCLRDRYPFARPIGRGRASRRG